MLLFFRMYLHKRLALFLFTFAAALRSILVDKSQPSLVTYNCMRFVFKGQAKLSK